MRKITAIAATLFALLASPVSAAHLNSFGERDVAGVITIEGPLEKGDAKKIADHLKLYPAGFIFLAAEDKNSEEARLIAHMIRKGDYITVSPNYVDCKGACALIWMAGTNRVIEPGATVHLRSRTIPIKDRKSLKIEPKEGEALQDIGQRSLVLRAYDEGSSPIAFVTATMSEIVEEEGGKILLLEAMEDIQKLNSQNP